MKAKMRQASRPINVGILDLLRFQWPVTAITSIVHRITGVILFAGLVVGLYALDLSLSSEQGFMQVSALASTFLGKLVILALLSSLVFHYIAGIKHLLMDLGIGESLQGGKLGAWLTILVSVLLVAWLASWLFNI